MSTAVYTAAITTRSPVITLSRAPTSPYLLTRAWTGHGWTTRRPRVARWSSGSLASGPDVPESQEMVFEAAVIASGQSDAGTFLDNVLASWKPSDTTEELTVTWADTTIRMRRGRPVVADVDMTLTPNGTVSTVRLVFDCLDPIWYSSLYSSAIVTMPVGGDGVVVASGGVTVASGGVDVTGGSTSGDAAVVNVGSADVDWSAIVVGPVTNPRLLINGVGVTVNYDLPAASTALVDTRTRSVRINGVLRPLIDLSSQWPKLPANEVVTFSLRGDAGTGSATISWQDGWH